MPPEEITQFQNENKDLRPLGTKFENSEGLQNNDQENSQEDSQEGSLEETEEDNYIEEMIQRSGIDYITKKEGLSILMLIIQDERDDLFKKYIDQFKNIDHQNKYGATALVMASSSSNIDYVRKLLEMGANPNINFNKANFTLLMDAAMEGNAELVELLLLNKAEINALDKEGKTALIYACIEGNEEAFKVLLKYNADQSIKDQKKMNCFDYLVKNGHNILVKFLK